MIRTEAAEVKFLKSVSFYSIHGHETNQKFIKSSTRAPRA